MIIRITMLLTIFILAGCEDTSMDFAKAQFMCKDHGGLYNKGYIPNSEKFAATCRDGARIVISTEELASMNDPWIAEYMSKFDGK